MAPQEITATDAAAAADALATPPTEAMAPAAQAAASDPPAASREAPCLAAGVELIGEFTDSGLKEPPYIARRSDGQIVQMPELLFRLAEAVDCRTDHAGIADQFSDAIERRVEPADVQMLIETQLRPLGIVAERSGDEPAALNKIDPLLALKFRVAVVPERAVRALTTIFSPLFLPPVMVAATIGFLGLDGWLFFVHGVGQSVRHVLDDPLLMLALLGGVILATAFHETGHASACRYGGAKPGVMGVGLYLVWPAFYTDITDAYRLEKWGRLRTDIGGIYFNAIFSLVTAGLYFATSFQPLLLLIVLQNFEMVQQALPFLRLDGYYILSDLTGVPDVYLRVGAVFSSLIPGRKPDQRVTELKPWVRVAVTIYVLLISVVLALMLLAIVINLPRIVSTGYGSASTHWAQIGPAFSHGQVAKGILDAVQALFLILPLLGLGYTALRLIRRTLAGTARWSTGHPTRQLALGLGGAAGVAIAALSWLPNGDYKPIFPREKGTFVGLLKEIKALPTARPSLTPQAERQLQGAPANARSRSQPHSHGKKHRRRKAASSTTSTTSTTTPVVSPSPTSSSTPGAASTPTTTSTTPTTETTPTTSTISTLSTTPASTTPTSTTPASTTPTSTTPASTTPTSTTPASGSSTTPTVTTPAGQ